MASHTARSAISQAKKVVPVLTACLTPGGPNTSSGNTEHAAQPLCSSRCLPKKKKKKKQSLINAAANVNVNKVETGVHQVEDTRKTLSSKEYCGQTTREHENATYNNPETKSNCSSAEKNKSDENFQKAFEHNGTSQSGKRYDILNKISNAFQDIQLSGNDKSLYEDVMDKATLENYRFPHYGQLRVRLESGREVVIEIGDGEDSVSCCFRNGKTDWTSTSPPVTKYWSKNSFLGSNDVLDATANMILNEQERKLVRDTEAAVGMRNQTEQIKNAMLTISFETGKRVEIYHGEPCLYIKPVMSEGKLDLITENGSNYVRILKALNKHLPSLETVCQYLNTLANIIIVVFKIKDLLSPSTTKAAEGALSTVAQKAATST